MQWWANDFASEAILVNINGKVNVAPPQQQQEPQFPQGKGEKTRLEGKHKYKNERQNFIEKK